MNTPSLPSTPLEGGQRQERPAARPIRQLWLRSIRWIQENTFAPRWLPEPLRQPITGYLIAVLVELATVTLILLLLSSFPAFDFSPILPLTGVILIALGWGTGPSLLAILLGTLLLDLLVLAPHFSLVIVDPVDGVGLILYLVVGVGVSLLAGRSEKARREDRPLTGAGRGQESLRV